MKIIFKILKSKGWSYDKTTKTWGHKAYNFTVDCTDFYSVGFMRFYQLYKDQFYTLDLKARGCFINRQKYLTRKEKLRNYYY